MSVQNTKMPALSRAWLQTAEYFGTEYDSEYKGWKTTTQLAAPAQQVVLKSRHKDQIVEELADQASMLLGSCGHEALYKAALAAGDGAIVEQRFCIDFNGHEIGIKADRVEEIEEKPGEYRLIEFKFAKTWSVILGTKPEWLWQCAINAYALRSIGINITEARNEVFITNWSATELERSGRDYPRTPIVVVEHKPMLDEEVEAYMSAKIEKLLTAESLPDEELPRCTDDEMWAKMDSFPIYKKSNNRKRATAKKGLTTRASAVAKMREKGWSEDEYEIVYIPGERTMCEKYCPVKQFCHQYQKTKAL